MSEVPGGVPFAAGEVCGDVTGVAVHAKGDRGDPKGPREVLGHVGGDVVASFHPAGLAEIEDHAVFRVEAREGRLVLPAVLLGAEQAGEDRGELDLRQRRIVDQLHRGRAHDVGMVIGHRLLGGSQGRHRCHGHDGNQKAFHDRAPSAMIGEDTRLSKLGFRL